MCTFATESRSRECIIFRPCVERPRQRRRDAFIANFERKLMAMVAKLADENTREWALFSMIAPARIAPELHEPGAYVVVRNSSTRFRAINTCFDPFPASGEWNFFIWYCLRRRHLALSNSLSSTGLIAQVTAQRTLLRCAAKQWSFVVSVNRRIIRWIRSSRNKCSPSAGERSLRCLNSMCVTAVRAIVIRDTQIFDLQSINLSRLSHSDGIDWN